MADSQTWWRQKRLTYNVALLTAGFAAFVLYAVIFQALIDRLPEEAEFTAFTVIGQGIGFLAMMVVANVFYNLGATVERFLRPMNVEGFRKTAFQLGLWFSVALILSLPLGFAALVYLFSSPQF